jgi:hypothetical protein
MDFVTFEIAKKLKEKGFKEECLCHYIGNDLVYNIESPIANNQLWFSHNKFDNIWHRDNIDAPTISQVLKWLREEKKLHVRASVYFIGWCVDVTNMDGKRIYSTECEYYNYEQAVLVGIEYVLDNLNLIKNNN